MEVKEPPVGDAFHAVVCVMGVGDAAEMIEYEGDWFNDEIDFLK